MLVGIAIIGSDHGSCWTGPCTDAREHPRAGHATEADNEHWTAGPRVEMAPAPHKHLWTSNDCSRMLLTCTVFWPQSSSCFLGGKSLRVLLFQPIGKKICFEIGRSVLHVDGLTETTYPSDVKGDLHGLKLRGHGRRRCILHDKISVKTRASSQHLLSYMFTFCSWGMVTNLF